MSKPIKIHEGLSYEYLIHGVMTIIGGIVVGFFFYRILPIAIAIWILSFISGILMCISKTGVEIDPNEKTIRKYIDWTVFKTGRRYSLEKIIKVELKYNSQISKSTRPLYMNKEDTTAKTYDLILTSDLEQSVLLNGFTKVSLAIKCFDALKDISDYQMENHVLDMLKNQRSSRRR